MSMRYWAVRPTNQPDQIRIEKAENGRKASDLAFGRSGMKPQYMVGRYEVKDMGSRVSVIRSDKRRIALLRDRENWVDPYL